MGYKKCIQLKKIKAFLLDVSDVWITLYAIMKKKKMYILFYAKNMNTNIYLVCLCVCKAKRKPVSVIAAAELGNWGVSG